MEFEIEWVDESLVICRTLGAASVEGYQAMMEALISQPGFRPGVDLIVDHTNVDVSALSAAEIERVAGVRARFAGDIAGRAAGVVGAGSPMRYGLGRMFEAFLESQPSTEIKVFETVEDAMVWLRGTDSTAPAAS